MMHQTAAEVKPRPAEPTAAERAIRLYQEADDLTWTDFPAELFNAYEPDNAIEWWLRQEEATGRIEEDEARARHEMGLCL